MNGLDHSEASQILSKTITIDDPNEKEGAEQSWIIHALNKTYHDLMLKGARFADADDVKINKDLKLNQWNDQTDVSEYLGHPLYHVIN